MVGVGVALRVGEGEELSMGEGLSVGGAVVGCVLGSEVVGCPEQAAKVIAVKEEMARAARRLMNFFREFIWA